MKQLQLTLLFCCMHFCVFAQVSEHFTDNNFTDDPEWAGDDSLFSVVSGELRLNGSAGSDAHLATTHHSADSMVWGFRCRFLLNPSSQNFARFYLMSDQQNLEAPLNGYYVQLGGSTGTSDSISLYKQSGNQRTKLIAGRPSTVSKLQNHVAVKVFRDHSGNWTLYSDTSGGSDYVTEGWASDNEFISCNYLGWFVRYTSGNNQRFYLDDVLAYMPVADTIPPDADSIVVENDRNITVYFNERIDSIFSLNLLNYQLNPSGKNPIQAVWIDHKTVRLSFADSFLSETSYTLSISGIRDTSGNIMPARSFPFLFYRSALYDLLISEWMPDPSPALLLPEKEYVELYNNAPVPVNIKGYTLSDGSSVATLPNEVISPGSFVIVCAQADAAVFAQYGKTIAVSNMPSLNNTSDELILKDRNGQVVHHLSYDLSWYRDQHKENGGWSLELNFPNQLCRGKMIYSASSDPSGGTPGQKSSLWDTARDSSAPVVVSAIPTGPEQAMIVFNEPVNPALIIPASVTLQPVVLIGSLSFSGDDSLYINLATSFANNTSYLVMINNATDCSGNTMTVSASFDYFSPQPARNFDVLIHEIMADPSPAQQLPDAEYIELYNRSNKIISLNGWTIEDAGSSGTLPDILLHPDSFLVITHPSNSGMFPVKAHGISGFPSLGNDGDKLVLKNENGQVIHTIHYTSEWYRDGFKQSGGWSLEMTDVQNPCGTDNWKVCTDQQGGTPGAPNSIRSVNRDKTPPRLMRVYPIDSNRLQLHFNEALDSASLIPGRFLLNGVAYPVLLYGNAPDYQSTVMWFADAFDDDVIHTLLIADSVNDCAGNGIEDYRSVDFMMPYEADSSSLVINEVLFNSRAGAHDFVELYNSSSKAVDLKPLMIGRKEPDGTTSGFTNFAPEGFVLKPGEYAVLTPDASSLMQHYYCKDPALIIQTALPSYNDDEGTVVLMKRDGQVFDEFSYDQEMHFPMLDNQDGVSLERIDYLRSSDDRTNWTSAAASVGYATPTYQNSQRRGTDQSNRTLNLQPPVISPDGDGYQDVMNLNYLLDGSGFTGSLLIYDASGRLVKNLFRNEILGTTGTYTWNGMLDDGNPAPPGIYLFYFEAFTHDGVRKKYSAVGVVATKL